MTPNQWANEARIKIRREIAAQAMMGLLADDKDHDDERCINETCPQAVARLAVGYADALLIELNKTSP